MDNRLLYILGLILTDGWYNNGLYSIELKDEDANILEQIAEHYSCNIYHRVRDTNFKQGYGCTRIDIKDKEIIGFLSQYVPKTNKTTNAVIPQEYLLSPSLWRGILDGDGSYGYRKETPYVSFVTINENFKNGFCYAVKQVVGQELSASRNKRDNAYNLGVTSVKAKQFIKWLLSEETFGIVRKKEMMLEIMNWIPSGRQGESRRRWTKEEDDYVYTHSNKECLEQLNRSLAAIQCRRTKLNKERKNG